MTGSERGQRYDTNSWWLLAWLAAVLSATLLPLDFTTATPDGGLFDVDRDEILDVVDIASNLLLFAPLGVLLVLRRGIRTDPGPVMAAAGAIAFGVSLSVELLQQWLPSREASVLDVLCNTAGAVIGAYSYRVWGADAIAWIKQIHVHSSATFRVAVLSGLSVTLLVICGVIQYAARLDGWDEEFPLLIGNEYTGNRPWHGRLFSIDLSDEAATDAVLKDFAAGNVRNPTPGNILRIHWASENPDAWVEQSPVPFLAMGTENPATPAGLRSGEHAWLQSARAPREIALRIQASNEFTIRLVCASDEAHQIGPARIVSYSIDTMLRNFTVAQDASDLILRLRTPVTGPNGTRFSLIVPRLFSSTAVRDILITFGDSTLRAAVAGTNQIYTLDFGPATVLASFYLDSERLQLRYLNQLLFAVLAVLHIGIIAWLSRSGTAYFGASILWLVLFAVLMEATLAFVAPRPFSWSNPGMNLAAGCVPLILIAVIRSRLHSRASATSRVEALAPQETGAAAAGTSRSYGNSS